MSLINQQLDIPARLRLRKTFARWNRNPAAFSADLEDAQRVFDLVTKEGYKLEIDRRGIPRAIAPQHLILTGPELKRFHARVATMTDEAEISSTKAHMMACFTRGFTPTVDASGKFTAQAPRQVQRQDPDWQQKQREHKSYWAKRGGQSAFKTLPTKII
jgi:hypothetical protein